MSVTPAGLRGTPPAAANSDSNSSTSASSRRNIDLHAVYRHHWAVPVVGFDTRLVLPLHSFEAWEGEEQQPIELVGASLGFLFAAVLAVAAADAFAVAALCREPRGSVVLVLVSRSSEVPSEVFGQPLRPDILHQVRQCSFLSEALKRGWGFFVGAEVAAEEACSEVSPGPRSHAPPNL